MMKGFIRILESILASIILMGAMAYFFEPVVKYSDWSDTATSVEAGDALIVMGKNGKLDEYINYVNIDEVDCNKGCSDKVALNGNLSELLPKTVAFSVEVRGRPNPIILIGCNCTNEQKAELENLLSPLIFIYKNRPIEIRIKNVAISAVNSMEPKPDILFIFGYKNLSEAQYKSHAELFLENGGSIFMLADLVQPSWLEGFLDEKFGLVWKVGASSTQGEFYNSGNINSTSYRIADYFMNISGLSSSESFNLNTNNIDIDYRTIIAAGSSYSFVKVNQLSRGKTVWFANYTTADNKLNNLTKALVMWASGESYKMDLYNKNIPEIYSSFHCIFGGEEPYEIRLIYWKVFY